MPSANVEVTEQRSKTTRTVSLKATNGTTIQFIRTEGSGYVDIRRYGNRAEPETIDHVFSNELPEAVQEIVAPLGSEKEE